MIILGAQTPSIANSVACVSYFLLTYVFTYLPAYLLAYGAQDETRESKMVFIGQKLDGEFLAGMFNKCLATPENLRRKA